MTDNVLMPTKKQIASNTAAAIAADMAIRFHNDKSSLHRKHFRLLSALHNSFGGNEPVLCARIAGKILHEPKSIDNNYWWEIRDFALEQIKKLEEK